MFVNENNKDANGYYGTTVSISCEDETWSFTGSNAMKFANSSSSVSKGDSQFVLKDGEKVALFGVEEYSGVQFALCSASFTLGSGIYYNGTDMSVIVGYGTHVVNEFTYILASRINWKEIENQIQSSLIKVTENGLNIDDNAEGNSALGKVWISTEETWVMNAHQIILRAHEKLRDDDKGLILDNVKDYYTDVIPENTFVSVIREETILGLECLLIVYNNKYRYVVKDKFKTVNGSPMVSQYPAVANGESDNRNVVKTTTVDISDVTALLTVDNVRNYLGSFEQNKDSGNYESILPSGSSVKVVGQESIGGTLFLLIMQNNKYFYIDSSCVEIDGLDKGAALNTIEPYTVENPDDDYTYNTNTELKDYSNIKYNNATPYSMIPKIDNSVKQSSKNTGSKYKPLVSGKFPPSMDMSSWEHTPPIGQYPESPYAPYLGDTPDRALPPLTTQDELEQLDAALRYELKSHSGTVDNRHLYKMNRFRLLTPDTGLSTKSFVFMSKPDLNLYKLDDNEMIIKGTMNEDLIRFPIFKYVGRNREIGSEILDSLEYWQTESHDTPWMSLITNLATNYTPIDREVGYTEVGETFHGNKIIYGKHDYKYQIAGTTTITFNEKRDLSLWLTIKLWTEYIHLLNLGYVEPHPSHIRECELDYAVALWYIQTDETMERIIYWEKLIGVFPIKCPDSFFEYDINEPGKKMEHSIEFAYSMRSVMDTNDLVELNRLYHKNIKSDEEFTVPDPFYSFNYDKNTNNAVIATLAHEYYNDDYNTILNNMEAVSKYYYEDWTAASGETYKFLSNYISKLGIHGIPYVKGPFIVTDPNMPGGKYLLKWV